MDRRVLSLAEHNLSSSSEAVSIHAPMIGYFFAFFYFFYSLNHGLKYDNSVNYMTDWPALISLKLRDLPVQHIVSLNVHDVLVPGR